MPVSGSFAGRYRPSNNTRNWGTGVDPDHANPDLPDPGTPPSTRGRLQRSLAVPEYVESYYGTREIIDPPSGTPWDQEPAEYDDPNQHRAQTLPWGVPDNNRLRMLSGRLHSQGKGAQWAYRKATMVMRDYTTVNESKRLQSLPGVPQGTGGAISGQALRALRGFNSLAVNNPGSAEVNFSGNYVRQGWELSRWTNRRMPRRRITHEKRVLHLNLAAVAKDTPGQAGPYSSPFDNYGRFQVGTRAPAQRREPRAWDEDAVTDYSQDDTSQYVQFRGGF